jgi:hypothetical protein
MRLDLGKSPIGLGNDRRRGEESDRQRRGGSRESESA